MSVDKAKDTPPKKPSTDNKIVEAKPESSTKTENKPDYIKKARYGRGSEAGIQSLQGQLERHFWKEEKAIAPVVCCTGTYAAAAVLVWSVAGGGLGEAANAHTK